MSIQESTIFGKLSSGLFRLFSGANAGFFADLLEYLDTEVFGIAGEMVSRRAAIDAIGEFIEREARELRFEDDDEGSALSAEESRDKDPRKYLAFRRLEATGWLIEHRDRYRRIVDFDPEARLLLQALLEIKSGRLRSYGGAVVQVQALLASAEDDAKGKWENVHNAARAARGFLNHLRSVTGAIRKLEKTLLEQANPKDLFGTYFETFVSQHLLSDFARLRTQENPYRVRNPVLDQAQEMAANALLIDDLAKAVLEEGRARDAQEAERALQDDLQAIVRVFEAIDDHLELIDAAEGRVQRRIGNTVRYIDRIAEARTGRIVEAMERLGALAVPDDAPVSAAHKLAGPELPLNADHLYQAARRRPALERKPIRKKPRDPALDRYTEALRAYEARAMLTPEKVAAFLERALGPADAVRGAEIAVNTLDDFFVFERLREFSFAFESRLAERYEVEILPGRVQNEWIDCPDFVIRRRAAEASPHAQQETAT